MQGFWFVVYNILFLPLLWVVFRFLSLFNSKIREGFRGRRGLFADISSWVYPHQGATRILIHSSSLGEFQQSIPIIEEFNKLNFNIISTFFSPSGYKNSRVPFPEIRKTYLPFDSYPNAVRFLDLIKPDMIILMRYDLWFNFLYAAKKRGIKLIIANARFDEKDLFWKIPVFRSFRKTMYGMIDKMLTIDEADRRNYRELMEHFSTEIVKTGDSKFERVYQASKSVKREEVLPESIYSGKKVFVIGSSWKDDEDVVLPALDKLLDSRNDLLTVLVPHEPKETKIKMIEKNLEERYNNFKSIRYSDIGNYSGENIIIIDCIGKLMSLYSIAYVSYVGGGFRSGLHNVLEPAIFNMPVFFANRVKNSDEDEIMLEKGCGIAVTDKKQFYKIFRKLMTDPSYRDELGSKCSLVFESAVGTSKNIVKNILDSNDVHQK